jgi:flagellar assembly factor FliW
LPVLRLHEYGTKSQKAHSAINLEHVIYGFEIKSFFIGDIPEAFNY